MEVLHSRHEKFKAFAQASGEIFNVADAAALLELPQTETAKILARWQKQGFIFRVQKEKTISKAKKELGYNPEVGLEDGMRKSIEWARKHQGLEI